MTTHIFSDVTALIAGLDGAVTIEGHSVGITDAGAVRETLIEKLVWSAVFGEPDVRTASRWLIRQVALASGAWPASIHELYMAGGRNEYANVTTPAINLRGMTFDLARTVFRAAQATQSMQVIFELARSEIGYTEQRPGEYAAVVLAAAVREGWSGPVFIQGDHYQASLKAYAQDPDKEITAIAELAAEAIAAGYGNIDIDASTLVDLDFPTLREQQEANYRNTAELTQRIRAIEPEGFPISIGAEIGEVGKNNSTVADLDAFMEGYSEELERRRARTGEEIVGISKISVQTGTSHGGVVLPDGTIEDVAVDFDTLGLLSDAARSKYAIGGAVQHGASTLPETAFGRFAAANAVEVHLATAFQNIVYDSAAFPADLLADIYAHLAANHGDERKADQTDAQFYYTTRKRGFGPFKRQLWSLPEETRTAITGELQPRFELIMRELRVAGQAELVERFVPRMDVDVPMPDVLARR
jgi:fructose/tagatose bisphosphate aldolase